MHPLHRYVGALLVLALLNSQAAAGPYSELIIFGDSLSDLGNTSQSTFGIQPGPFYSNGRFSNGPVYSEQLSVDLELGTMTTSSSGGDNFAYGGAQTTGTGGLTGFFIDDVDEQVDDFLGRGTVDPNALVVVFAGANDLLGVPADVNVPVGSLVADIGRLIDAEAKNFLVLNVPLLGATPRFNGDPIQAATMSTLTMDFNSALWTALDGLETAEPDVNFSRLDVAGLINEVIADPGAFGFTNATDSAAPGLAPGDSSYDTGLIVGNPEEYLFWDDIHPTTAAHAILAEHVLAAAQLPGDFDFDGDVDDNDFNDPVEGWQVRFADDLDGHDFLEWQQEYGTGGAALASVTIVPEPTAAFVFAPAALAISATRSRRARRRCASKSGR